MKAAIRGFVKLVHDTAALLRVREIRTLAVGTLILLLWQYFGYPFTYSEMIADKTGEWRYDLIAPNLYWTATNVILLLLLPLALEASQAKGSLRSFGLGIGDWRLGCAASVGGYVIMVPFIALAASRPDFQATYPLNQNSLLSHELFWVYEASYLLFFVGWEFFFRGYWLFTLEPALGMAAVAVQTVPFALMHVGKPFPEAIGSVFAGLFLGMLALRTRSIWYGVFLHAAVAGTMDIIVYLQRGIGK
ncbi:MAG TPA: CPBP family intramembrane metalloprotease [Candidatus Latescibacteria bacterium]|nr:CPBP family intramembrane metalloprotease [Candidatus Latescibacterota bacterium]